MLVVLVISSTVIAMGLTMMLVVAFPVVLSMVSSVMLSMVSSVMLVVTFPVMLSMVVPVMASRIWMRGGMIALDIGHIVPLVDEL